MRSIVYTLVADGPSDRILDHIIRWALRRERVPVEKGQWAESSLIRANGGTLKARIAEAARLYPADLIFIHRDAEAATRGARLQEIGAAALEEGTWIPIIPIRMTEAWFLHDESAVRRAAGNPHGRVELTLPSPMNVERCVDPKGILFNALLAASEAHGRRLVKLQRQGSLGSMRARTAELINGYDELHCVSAFSAFLEDLHSSLESLHKKIDEKSGSNRAR